MDFCESRLYLANYSIASLITLSWSTFAAFEQNKTQFDQVGQISNFFRGTRKDIQMEFFESCQLSNGSWNCNGINYFWRTKFANPSFNLIFSNVDVRTHGIEIHVVVWETTILLWLERWDWLQANLLQIPSSIATRVPRCQGMGAATPSISITITHKFSFCRYFNRNLMYMNE